MALWGHMGCRPSRRAAVCVRVAGDGPWGVGRSSRPVSAAGGVALRERNSGGRVAANPQDRYSAPPTDTHFPPHSCTTATYHHGCCARSRITLRLSNNGSTLEIETTEFQEDDRTCHLCRADEGASTSHATDTVQLRTQSAPNLATLTKDDSWYLPFSSPPPVARRLAGGVGGRCLFGSERLGSVTGSIRTSTAVDVEVNNISCTHAIAAAASANNHLPLDITVETEDATILGENENHNSGASVSEKENSSSGVESETPDAVENNSVIQPQCSEVLDMAFVNGDTPDKSTCSTSHRSTSATSTVEKSSNSIMDKSAKAEDSPSFLHSLKVSSAKVRIDSPKTMLKVVCHRSTDSLKKAWCHITSDSGRVAASAASGKWDRQSDESTDTGCESDEED